ncbi:MAG: feruloyl-CoA synthase, partial [Alphaproteobacteria bacterium]|nr:feruloyl-CoA synthase [Alphaproteobacteria bacterium]
MQDDAVYRAVRMGEMRATMTEGPAGVIYVRSAETLGPYPRAMTDCIERWAGERADTVFIADRGPDGAWRRITYGQAWPQIQALAQGLLDAGLTGERPLLILSGNEIEHALLG